MFTFTSILCNTMTYYQQVISISKWHVRHMENLLHSFQDLDNMSNLQNLHKAVSSASRGEHEKCENSFVW